VTAPASVVDRTRRPFRVAHLRWIVLGADALLLALNYGDRAALSVGAPYILNEFHFNDATWGLILSAFFVGYAPFCFVGGWSSDRFGPRKIMGTAVIWWSAFTALTVIGFNVVSFALLRILFGIGEGPQATVTAKLVGNWFPQRETGVALGIANGATPLGGAIATPLVIAMILGSGGNWRLPFIVLGIIGALFALGWFTIVRDTPESHPWMTVSELAALNSGRLPRKPEMVVDDTAPPVGFYLRRPIVWTTAFAFFGYAWVLYVFLSWFPLYLVQAHHIQIKSLAISATIPWIAGAFGFVSGGYLSDAIARRTGNAAQARKWTMVACLIAVGLAFAPSAFVQSVGAAVTLMSVCVFLLYLTGAQYFAILADTVPASRLGGVGGFVHFIANCAGILAPAITGSLVSATHSWVSGFVVGGGIVILGAIGVALFGRLDNLRTRACDVAPPSR
jgi:ACS family hexuronate transporter-like MFS transporter